MVGVRDDISFMSREKESIKKRVKKGIKKALQDIEREQIDIILFSGPYLWN